MSLKKENKALKAENQILKDKIRLLENNQYKNNNKSPMVHVETQESTKNRRIAREIINEINKMNETNKYARKYSDLYLSFCFILRTISFSAYKFVKQFLPLPCKNTIQKEFGTIKKQYSEFICDINRISDIVSIFTKECDENKDTKEIVEHEIDVTISTDAFSIEPFKDDKYMFIFECLPLSGILPTFPLHLRAVKNGSATNLIDSRITEIFLKLKNCHIKSRFLVTDGDPYWNKKHENYFQEWYKTFQSEGLSAILKPDNSNNIAPLADFLHLMKQFRNKLVNNTITLDTNTLNHVITGKTIDETLKLGKALLDNSGASKMMDCYPLQLFELKNVIKLLEFEKYDEALYLLPHTLFTVAQTKLGFDKETRRNIYDDVFLCYEEVYKMVTHDHLSCIGEQARENIAAVYPARKIDIIRTLNTLKGLISSFDLNIPHMQSDRFSTHPSENRIGTIREGSSHHHTCENAIHVNMKATICHDLSQKLGIEQRHEKRAKLSGVQIDSTFTGAHLCSPGVSMAYLYRSIKEKGGIIEKTEDCEYKLDILIRYLKDIVSHTKYSSHFQADLDQKSKMQASAILARLITLGDSNKNALKKLPGILRSGELILINHLLAKTTDERELVKYFPRRNIDQIYSTVSIIKHIHDPITIDKTYFGIINAGNTCYLNSVLQLIVHCQAYDSFLTCIDDAETQILNDIKSFFELMSKVVEVKDVRRFIKNILPNFRQVKMNPYNQNDALEFYIMLMGIITEGITNQQKKDKWVNLRFSNSTVQYECNKGHKSVKSEITDMYFIHLDEYKIIYLKEEILKAENPYDLEVKCVDCNNNVNAKGGRMFERISHVFTICIVRYDNESKKRANKIIFPLELVINFQLFPNTIYQLTSFIVHFGEDTNSGHYVCFASENVIWKKFDDNTINDIEITEVIMADEIQSSVYILCYEKVEFNS